MDRLSGVEERLDGPLDDPRALAGNLRDLARVNRWFGGVRLSATAIESVAPGGAPLHVLDVGTGGADIPLALIERGRAAGRLVTVTGIDSRPEVLAAAAIIDPRATATGELTLHVGDGLALPFADRSFDVVHCSLVVHHLEPHAARTLLAEMCRVALRGVVVNDLVRGRAAWIGAWMLSHTLTRNPLTRHDAPLSVRRAYTVAELTALLAAAGLRVVARTDGLLGHRVALAARPVGMA
ncbi:MAG: methyltransferase domain-containing protein [Candidatus Limnocylindrales bacterium]